MLLIDGVKYDLWTPSNEDEFERIAGEHAEDIFGKDAKYFDLKHKLASRSGTGSIPDGYVISLGDKPEVQIIEMELASHSLNHIVSQMVNIINGIDNPSTQQKICNAIDDGINEDDIFATKISKAIRPVTIHRFLSDSFSKTLPTINIIIDESLPKLEEAVRKISAASRIIEFKTFRRIGADAVHAHLFEPIFRLVSSPEEHAEESLTSEGQAKSWPMSRQGQVSTGVVMHLQTKGITASGERTQNGFMVFKGSQAASEEGQLASSKIKEQRNKLIKSGILIRRDHYLEFSEDYTFKSPSGAGDVITGRSTNGLTAWKNEQGATLNELEKP